MRRIGAILRYPLFALWMPLWLVIGFFVSSVSPAGARWGMRHFWAPGLLWLGGVRVTVLHDELPDPSRPTVYVMNHQSFLDIAVACCALPVTPRFVAKMELDAVPLLSWFIRRTGMIFIARGAVRAARESLDQAADALFSGASVLFYPEGTRSTDGRIHRFRKGPFVVARRAGAPVVPIVVEGTRDALPAGAWIVQSARVRVRVGKPIAVTGDTNAEFVSTLARGEMGELHRSIGGLGETDEDVVDDDEAEEADGHI